MFAAGYSFLAIAVVGAWLTLNAHIPLRGSGTFMFPSFIAGWLTSELALHHLALQLVVTALFVAGGALDAWPGQLAMGMTVLSWIGLLSLQLNARGAALTLEVAVREGLSAHAIEVPELAPPPSRPFAPFTRSDAAVVATLDLRYAEGAGSRHLLDVYTPRQRPTRAPVLLQIHGGGWFTGHKRQQAMPLMLHMARNGWVCVAANYRLSPRATFPEHLIDPKLALCWIREHIAEYGGDPEYVVVTGGSAGGHLCAMLALTPNDPEYQPGHETVDTSVRACVPFYGVYDLTDRLGHQRHDGLSRLISRWVLKKLFEREPQAFDRASPMSHVGPCAPPFFVIHGTHDNLASVEDARAFVALLRERSQQPVVYAELKGAHHAFEFFHSARTARVVHAVARFLVAIRERDMRDRAADARAFDAQARAQLP